MFWAGKVNQHIDTTTRLRVTDEDGRSGAGVDILTYCQKFYPATTKYIPYAMESTSTRRDGGNTGGPYSSTKQSYRCQE